MKIPTRHCPNCNSELLLLGGGPSRHKLGGKVVSIFGLDLPLVGIEGIGVLVCAGLGTTYSLLWFILAAVLVGHMVFLYCFSPIEGEFTYKCQSCGKVHNLKGEMRFF